MGEEGRNHGICTDCSERKAGTKATRYNSPVDLPAVENASEY